MLIVRKSGISMPDGPLLSHAGNFAALRNLLLEDEGHFAHETLFLGNDYAKVDLQPALGRGYVEFISVAENFFVVEVKWDQAIAEFNIDVPFGDGVITNILGWRDYASDGGGDIDGTINTAFHARFKTIQDQLSNELRYAGHFGRVKLTTGLYWFTQDLTYIENRILADGAINSTYGGEQNQDTYGAFAQTDIDLTNTLVLTLGARYSKEEKDARIATFVPSTAGSPCNFDLETCRVFNFIDSEEWTDTSPKVGLQWRINDDAHRKHR